MIRDEFLILAARFQFSLDDPLFLTSLALVGSLLIAAIVLALVKRSRKKEPKEVPVAGDQLSHFRSLYDRGELSREEFEQIRAKLGTKLRKEMQVPVKNDAPTEPPTKPDPPANGSPKP